MECFWGVKGECFLHEGSVLGFVFFFFTANTTSECFLQGSESSLARYTEVSPRWTQDRCSFIWVKIIIIIIMGTELAIIIMIIMGTDLALPQLLSPR